MAPSPRPDLVLKAILAGTLGHIQIKPSVYREIRDDPDLAPYSPAGIKEILRSFVMGGQDLEVRQETRKEWLEDCPDDPWWYRAVIPVPGFPKGLFQEVKLIDDDENDPWVEIVSVHRQT
jgi:hypothetical protein